jgi:hypothetical protein
MLYWLSCTVSFLLKMIFRYIPGISFLGWYFNIHYPYSALRLENQHFCLATAYLKSFVVQTIAVKSERNILNFFTVNCYHVPREVATQAASSAAYCCHSFRLVPS